MIDYANLATNATVSDDDLLAAPGRAPKQPNPFLPLVKAAAKDGKRRDLPRRFSLTPYTGRKTACEYYTVTGRLHAATRELGVKVQIRKLDPTADDAGLSFKIVKDVRLG